MDKNKIILIALIIIVYLASTGFSYFIFSKAFGSSGKLSSPITQPKKTADGKLVFDPELPKTEECPLNGEMYSKQQKQWWEKHRPLGVMIENHEGARPQSGLSFADVIYEAVAEGGITRVLSIYYCQDAGQIGPVRSARTYFLDFLSEYGDYPLYAHVGGANQPGPADALSQLSDYGWEGYNDMNQFSIGFPVFWRDYDRLGHTAATEHTMYSTTEKLWEYGAKTRKLTNKDEKGKQWDKNFATYTFKKDEDSAKRPKTQTAHLEFWSSDKDYFIDWIYDPMSNLYKRNNGASQYIDRNTNKQLTSKNIVVLFMQESSANDGYERNLHLLYKTKGTGKAVILMDGKQTVGKWKKDSRTARTLIFDNKGDPVKFNRGLIWFEILPTDGILTVK